MVPWGEFLNDPREVHALMHGFFRSVRHPDPRKPEPKREDAKAEPHYWQAGWLLGDVVQLVGAVLIGGRVSGIW